MSEAFLIFLVIWAWAAALLGFGAFVEWLGHLMRRRKG